MSLGDTLALAPLLGAALASVLALEALALAFTLDGALALAPATNWTDPLASGATPPDGISASPDTEKYVLKAAMTASATAPPVSCLLYLWGENFIGLSDLNLLDDTAPAWWR
jgi:hypothetical protein